MAETEKKILLRVETGDSKKTVKSLKQDISDLKDAILNLDEGTDDYVNAVNELQKAQRELNKVQALTKESAVALDGSYDALTHQMALLRKEWKATNDEARRNELGKQIDEINDQLKELDGSIGNFQRNVGNYQSALDGVNVQQKDFGERMSDMQKQIEPTKMKFESVSNIASGLASGFAAAQGAMALLGVESKDFEKTMIKIQAAMALAQGIGGLSGLVEGLGKAKVAFQSVDTGVKALNNTMGKTGWLAVILLVITAVVSLVSHLNKKNKAIVDGTSALREYNKVGREAVSTVSDEILKVKMLEQIATDAAIADEHRTAAAQELLRIMGQEITDVNTLAVKNGELKKEIDGVTAALIKQAMAAAQMEKLKELYKLYIDAQSIDDWNPDFGTRAKALYAEFVNTVNPLVGASTMETPYEIFLADYEKKIAGAKKAYENYAKTILNNTDTAELLKALGLTTTTTGTTGTTTTTTSPKTTTPKKKTVKELLAEIQEEMYNDIINMTFDDEITIDDTTTKPTGYQYQNGDAEKRYGFWNGIIDSETSQKVRRMALDGASQEEQDAELIKGEERKLQKLKEFWEQARSEGDITGELALRQQIADQELLIEEEKNRAIVESAERAKEKRLKIMEEVSQGIQAAGAVVQGLTDIYQASAEKDGEITKEEAKKLKGLQIASATINMLQGAVTAFSSAQSLGPIAGPIVGAVNAAAVVAMGMANIQKIRNADLTGGVSSGGGASVIPSYGSYSSELPVNYTRNVTTSSEVDELNKDTKVYILESDLTEASNRVQVRQNESSF